MYENMCIYIYVFYIYKCTYAGTTNSSSGPLPAVAAVQEGCGSGVAPNEGGKGEGFTSTRSSVEKGTHISQVSERTTSTRHMRSRDRRASRCPVYICMFLLFFFMCMYTYMSIYINI